MQPIQLDGISPDKSNVGDLAIPRSVHLYDLDRTTPSVKTRVRLESTRSTESTIYRFGTTAGLHFLTHAYDVVNWPAVSVKKEFENDTEICWTPYIGVFHKESITMKCGDEENTLTSNQILIDAILNTEGSKSPVFNMQTGNVDFLVNWTKSLPAYETTTAFPFAFSRSDSLAFPLLYCSQLPFSFSVKFRSGNRLLRVRVKRDDVWVDISDEPEKWINRIESQALINGELMIPDSELWAKCKTVSEQEQQKFSGYNKAKNNEFDGKESYTIFMDEYHSIRSANPVEYGAVETLEVEGESPVLTAYWVGENITASNKNYHGNFTTNYENASAGWNPIKPVYTPMMMKEGETSSVHQSMAELTQFRGTPPTMGYNVETYSNNIYSTSVETSFNLDKFKYRFKIANTNTNPLTRNITQEKSKFVVELVLRVVRKWVFTRIPETMKNEQAPYKVEVFPKRLM